MNKGYKLNVIVLQILTNRKGDCKYKSSTNEIQFDFSYLKSQDQ